MRKGMPGLAALVAASLDKDPLSGDVFVFRGRKGDQIKVLWFSGDGRTFISSDWNAVGLFGQAHLMDRHY
jgi:transposase